jgi:PAS domain S-box-containing protein
LDHVDVDRLLLAAVAFSDDAIITKTIDGKITSWNRSAERMFGYSAHEAVGQPIFFIIPTELQEEERDILRRLHRGEAVEHFETVRRAKSGRLVEVSLSVSPVKSPTGKIIGATKIARDISKQKESERILRQAQKLEAVGHLTGGVAHDFNNILTVITGTIDLLADELGDRPDLLQITDLISQAASRGSELTSRLLAFARKQPLSPVATDVNTLVRQSVDLLKRTFPENIELAVDLKPTIAAAMVDSDQLVTALLNLALNARDAMPEGGKLTIETNDASLDEEYIAENPEALPGRHLVIAMSDNGVGIPKEIQSKVFEPFFTTKPVGRGSGLGLSMVYGFVSQSKGYLKIYSEEGLGTTVKIYLPQADGPADRTSVRPERAEAGGSETILVVEDDRLVRETTERQLKALGYNVVAVAGGSSALDYLSKSQCDLMLTDIVMPGINGKRLAELAVEIHRDLKVVFMSGYTENSIIHHGRLDPGVLLLSKPFRKAEIARMVRRALD